MFPTPIRHVITVVLENENSGTVLSQGPFERYLASKYGYASSYYAICHPSAPNYLGLTSGAAYQCGSDGYARYDARNIADAVESAGLSWDAYMESMPVPCDTSNSGNYVVRHDPFVYYDDIVSNVSRCDEHVVGFSDWNSSVASGIIPNYGFVVPNILDDGHDTNVGYADTWLRNWLTPLLNDSFFQSSVFFITYDESGGSGTGYGGLYGGEVYLAAVSPDVYANSTYSTDASHYNLLATTEWLLGLKSTGANDCSSSFPPMKSLFRSTNSTEYDLSGQVTSAATGSGISGAAVTAECGSSGSTNTSGSYELHLANGTHALTVSAPGYGWLNVSVDVAGAGVSQNFTLAPSPPRSPPPGPPLWLYIALGAAFGALAAGVVLAARRR